MQFWIVDTFSSNMFEGNPAAVCLLEKNLTQQTLQKIAEEFNVNETVFISPLQNQHFHIRLFTPFSEDSLCGHGLLAAAHVLWNELELEGIDKNLIYFDTKYGIFVVSKKDDIISIRLNKKVDELTAVPDRLINALGIPPISVSKYEQIYIVELFSVKQILKLEPDIAKLEKIQCKGVIVTAEYGNDVSIDFASRFFAPSEGIKEDHLTMWNYAFLGPYWQGRLNKSSLIATQITNRKNSISIDCDGEYVNVSGECAISASGSLRNINSWSFSGDLFKDFE